MDWKETQGRLYRHHLFYEFPNHKPVRDECVFGSGSWLHSPRGYWRLNICVRYFTTRRRQRYPTSAKASLRSGLPMELESTLCLQDMVTMACFYLDTLVLRLPNSQHWSDIPHGQGSARLSGQGYPSGPLCRGTNFREWQFNPLTIVAAPWDDWSGPSPTLWSCQLHDWWRILRRRVGRLHNPQRFIFLTYFVFSGQLIW